MSDAANDNNGVAPCAICGRPTDLMCVDCAIDSPESERVRVCHSTECRDRHENARHGAHWPVSE